MEAQAPENDTFFIRAAMISGKLTSVIETAKRLSLAAKNAKAIAMRAGSQARGFQPLTDFINEIGVNTQNLARTINEESLYMSRCASARLHIQEAQRQFTATLNKDPENTEVISEIIARSELEMRQLNTKIENHLKVLRYQIDEIIKSVRAAGVISTSSRIEAINSKNHRTDLETVANTVDESANYINTVVRDCQHILSAGG